MRNCQTGFAYTPSLSPLPGAKKFDFFRKPRPFSQKKIMIVRAFTICFFQLLLHVIPFLPSGCLFRPRRMPQPRSRRMLPRALPRVPTCNYHSRHHQAPARDANRRDMASPRPDRRLLGHAGPNAGGPCAFGIFPQHGRRRWSAGLEIYGGELYRAAQDIAAG